MATAVLNPSNLLFTTDGSATAVQLTAGANLLTLNTGATAVRVTNLAAPTADSDATTKQYVDGVAAGLDVKVSVRVATTGAGTLASDFANGDTVDGVTLATNDRILIKNQADGTENGIYTVNASGAPTRASDFDDDATVAGAFTFVEEGTTNADSGFVVTNNAGGDTVDTHSIVFTQFSGAGQITADTNLSKSGDTLNLDNDIVLTSGSITDSSGTLSFGDDNLTTTGTLTAATGSTVGNLTLEIGRES